MRTRTVLVALVLGVGSAQAAWGFGSSAVAPPPTPVEPQELPSPVPAQDDPFQDVDSGSLHHDSPSPVLSAPVVPAPAVPTPKPYPGLEYSIGPFKLRPAELTYEIAALGSLIFYILASLLGARANASRAETWLKANAPTFRKQFAAFGTGKNQDYQKDGGDEFVAYGTGRRGVESVQVTVKTKATHDLLVGFYHFVRSALDFSYDSGADKITIDLKLRMPKGTPGANFRFALVQRTILRAIRDQRWDLQTFTNTSEFVGLPGDLIVMTESGDLTQALLKAPNDSGLLEAVATSAPGREYFESLIISDMPAIQPDEDKPVLPENNYHLILTLRLPPSSKSAETKPFIDLICNLADVLHSREKLISHMAVSKLSGRRREVVALLALPIVREKKEVEKEKKEDQVAAKKRLELEREEAKLRQMTKADRVAYLEKKKEHERKQALLKLAKKVKK